MYFEAYNVEVQNSDRTKDGWISTEICFVSRKLNDRYMKNGITQTVMVIYTVTLREAKKGRQTENMDF